VPRIPFSFSGSYRGWRFRSLRELSYAIKLDAEGRTWTTAEKPELSVTYVDRYGKTHKHWADFFVDGNTIVEIKPKKKQKHKIVCLKSAAMQTWCDTQGYSYIITCPRKLSKPTLKKLYTDKTITIDSHLIFKFEAYINENRFHRSSWHTKNNNG
jgi:hypothetical protein